MSNQQRDLPPQVIAALAQGKKVEAVKLLAQATGLGPRDAMKLIESRIRSGRAPADAPAPVVRATTTTTATRATATPAATPRLSPDEVRRAAEALGAALKRGDWPEAIRHFGTLTGSDMRRMAHTVENLATKYLSLSGNFTQSGLSPGEVPRTPLWQVYLVVIALVLLLYFLLFGFK